MRFAESVGLYGEGIGRVDRNLRFVEVNTALAKYHRRAPEDFAGKKVDALLPREIWTLVAPLYAYVLETQLPVIGIEFHTRALRPEITLLCRANYSALAGVGLLARVSYEAVNQSEGSCNHRNEPLAYDQLLSTLSRAELPVLNLIGRGKGTKDIASVLQISYQTVATHRKNICRKLAVHSTAELVNFATRCHDAGIRN